MFFFLIERLIELHCPKKGQISLINSKKDPQGLTHFHAIICVLLMQYFLIWLPSIYHYTPKGAEVRAQVMLGACTDETIQNKQKHSFHRRTL